MTWYIWTSLTALLICVVVLGIYFVRLLMKGSPKDLSQKSGNIAQAICYSCIGAMSPMQKESAYLHLPTYTAGIFFHIGNFLSLAVYVLLLVDLFFEISLPAAIIIPLAIILIVSGCCGLGLFIKRLAKQELRALSCGDDYFSNLICTLVNFLSAIILLGLPIVLIESTGIIYFITMAIFFLWMPIGKIKHVIYFFFARYHLGFFYGWRGTWPPKKALQYDK